MNASKQRSTVSRIDISLISLRIAIVSSSKRSALFDVLNHPEVSTIGVMLASNLIKQFHRIEPTVLGLRNIKHLTHDNKATAILNDAAGDIHSRRGDLDVHRIVRKLTLPNNRFN